MIDARDFCQKPPALSRPAQPGPALEILRNIRSQVQFLRVEACRGGPHILMSINDLALEFEAYFQTIADTVTTPDDLSDYVMDLQADFMDEFVRHAEDCRAANGELSEHFLRFLEAAPLRPLPRR